MTPKQSDWTNNWFDALEAAGEYSALFVKYMTENYGLNTADVHAVAFSYGTNVIGICSIVHSNLDIANKFIRPFMFTISNNSLHQM